MVRRSPLDDAERLVVPAQYLEPFQVAGGQQPSTGFRFQLPGEGGSEGLLPGPLPPLRDPEPPVDQPLPQLNQPPSDVTAGNMPPELAAAADMYWRASQAPRKTGSGASGKRGDPEGLDFYMKVPGQVEFVNGEPWIHDETSQSQPWRRYTAEHAYDPKTGQIYEALRGDEPVPPLAGNLSEIGPRAEYVAREAVTSPFTAFGRFMERAKLGLVAPRFVDAQEASIIAGAIQSGTAFGMMPRAARAGATSAEGLTEGDLARLGMERPPARPSIESTLPSPEPQPQPQGPGSQYRIRPGGVRPQGHVTADQLLAERRAAFLRSMQPETDEAGFYVHALEKAKRDLPESGTAHEMRQSLRDMGVTDAEATMLGLDRLFLGEAGVARESLRAAEQQLSRAANNYDKVIKKAQRHPDNTEYRRLAAEKQREFKELLMQMPERRRELGAAAERHLTDATQAYRQAELNLKRINAELRKVREEGRSGNFPAYDPANPRSVEYPGVNLLDARREARRAVSETRSALEAARANDPGLRTITRDQIVQHIRENRPRLGLEVREYPPQRFGAMTGPIDRIRNPPVNAPNAFETQLIRRGVDARTASDMAIDFSTLSPLEWGQRATALSSHMRNPNMVREALEEAAGARLVDMVQAWRASHMDTATGRTQPPRYKMAIPDGDNPTMREIAVVLEGPWSARRDVNARIRELEREKDRLNLFREDGPAQGTPQYEAERARFDELSEQIRQLGRDRQALPKPPFTASGHWSQDIAPIGHMQTTIQRAPAGQSTREAALTGRLKEKLARLHERKIELERDLGPADAVQVDNAAELLQQLQRTERQIAEVESQLPQTRAGSDTIYMGNQFQSDWAAAGMESGFRAPDVTAKLKAITARMMKLTADNKNLEETMMQLSRRAENEGQGPGMGRRIMAHQQRQHMTELEMQQFRQGRRDFRDIQEAIADNNEQLSRLREQANELERAPIGHSLVENTRAWLRPLLEKFVDEGLLSGSRYIGVPSGTTVLRHNPSTEGVRELYDQALRRELKYVMERRFGRNSYSEREINTMYSNNGQRAFNGQWFIIELPKGVRGGRGVRVMQGGVPAPPVQQQQEQQ